MTLPELREIANANDVPDTGTKPELIARLEKHFAEKAGV